MDKKDMCDVFNRCIENRVNTIECDQPSGICLVKKGIETMIFERLLADIDKEAFFDTEIDVETFETELIETVKNASSSVFDMANISLFVESEKQDGLDVIKFIIETTKKKDKKKKKKK